MADSALDQLTQDLGEFSRERDWEQFHTPKNLATALTVEAAELAEVFQWLTPEESLRLGSGTRSRPDRDRIRHSRPCRI